MKKVSTKQILIIIICFIAFMAIMMSKLVKDEDKKGVGIEWSKKTYEQKENSIKEYFNSTSGSSMSFQQDIKNSLLKQFNYPEEVEFDPKPFLLYTRVVDVDGGICFIDGKGIGKNKFGVKERFKYSVKYKYTDSLVTLLETKVWQ